MSNPFGDSLNTGETKVAEEKDTLGGFRVHDSGVYELTLHAVYAGKSDSGANSVTFVSKMEDGTDYTWTEWVTSGTAKGGKNFTVNDKGEAQYLPGYNRANAIAMLCCEKELAALTWETKVIKKFNKAAGAEINTEVPMATELQGKKILIGLQKQIVNKQVQNSTTKQWDNINEKRETNEVDKVFQVGSRRTLKEALAKQEKGEFIDKWIEANKEPRDRYKHNDKAPAAGTPGANPTGDKPTTSLFS